MEPIKVMHITQSVGGVETYLRQVVLNVDRNKFEIVIASSEETIQKFCVEQNIKHHHIQMSRGFNPLKDVFSIFRIRKLIKNEKPKLVHLHSSKAGFVGRIAAKTISCKSLFTPHGGSYLSFTGFKRVMFFMLELIGKKFTYKLLAISHTEAHRFIHEVGIKAENIFVIPNSLTIPETKIEIPNTLGQLKGNIKIGTIGRITPQKNPLLFADIAYDTIKKFPGAHFYFLGAGFHDHLREELDYKIKSYKIENNLHLINKGDHILALNFLRQLDIFILPSVYEGLPYALLEAMLEGVPCIVSKCDGNNDVINNNDNGFACLTREEYLEVITCLVLHKEKAKHIAERGRQYVIQKHDIRKNIKRLEEIYTEL
jgi:glycosyltransferase involved in cell wall biosynthesis